jgi:PncC family amidohydrolase
VVSQLLLDAGLTLVTAESCTGGLLAARLTDVPGSSALFERGLVAYSNEAKSELLGVDEALLAKHGAVSAEVAAAMAAGARRSARAGVAVALTGIAGPGGGTPEKPVGLVYIAVQTATASRVWRRVFPGDRDRVRRQAVTGALELVRRTLLGIGD